MFKDKEIKTDESVLPLTWNIANPLLRTLHIASGIFPYANTIDSIRSFVMAERQERYDRVLKRLPKEWKEKEVYKNNNHLNSYLVKREYEFLPSSEDLINDIFFRIIFLANDIQEVEHQNVQRDNDILFPVVFIDEKLKSKRQSLKVIHIGLALIFVFCLAAGLKETQVKEKQTLNNARYSESKKQILPLVSQKESQELPVRLKIPSINVDAAVEYMGLTTGGEMDVPGNTIDVGWYKLGSRPGEKGNAVISGHFDGRYGEFGVFNYLDRIKKGDKMYIINKEGKTITFMVRESRIYNPGYADEVFLSNDDGSHLNLITCDGVWDGVKKSYSKRLVVFTDLTI